MIPAGTPITRARPASVTPCQASVHRTCQEVKPSTRRTAKITLPPPYRGDQQMADGQQRHPAQPGREELRQVLHLAEVEQVGRGSRAVHRELAALAALRQAGGQGPAAGGRGDPRPVPDEQRVGRRDSARRGQQVTQGTGSDLGTGPQVEAIAQGGEHGDPDDGHGVGPATRGRDTDGLPDPRVRSAQGPRAERDLPAGPGQAAGHRGRDERRAARLREHDRVGLHRPDQQRRAGPGGRPGRDLRVTADRGQRRGRDHRRPCY